MPRVIPAAGLALTAAHEVALSLDHPIVGWDSELSGVIASSFDANFPASNLLNPATHLKWKAGAQSSPPDSYFYLTGTFLVTDIDYVAIARHNLASIGCQISVGYFDALSPPNFVQLIPDTMLADDGPALFRFTTQQLNNIALRLTTFDTSSPPLALVPEIAVLYVGKLLVMPRKVYQGLTPINYARIAKVTNGKSEAGQFLGRIVLQEFVKDTIPLSLIDPGYYLDHIDAFMEASKETPFFFAWRPQSHPDGLGYCHMTNDPMPVNEAPHGLVAMQWEMTGII